MADAEAVRYDRQIRLWGKSMQQQLMHTNVVFDGIAGVAAEAAKNLVLAGVGGVAVADAAELDEVDAEENYLMQGEPGSTRAARAIRSLRRLNPYVRVCGSAAELQQANTLVRVVFIASLDEGSACVEAAAASPPALLVLHATLANTVVAFVLYRKLTTSCALAEQWRRLVADPPLLSEKPAAYQRVILSLYLHNGEAARLPFAEAAAAAYEWMDALQLQQLCAADVEAALRGSASVAGAVCATVAGACVAQHLIRQMGSPRAETDEQAHRWLACATGTEVECLTGM
ncbi:putative ubiquitin activating enzyme [Leptomonas pyrrhocoris]|uniref:Putative ubiquitin activating enzyme n=1 Tax=Leptomonas pyrrhocoris TaxID=157538 RepID=A0A0N0VHE5_LEPPY|nr:putative ubiquitin activating enzyme [Leptomonas pyrrhocoris]XP_015663974.1 putative ubiquitin activating enzyme [Leptomonas pyrrhocoris]KPA85534.1 putative ubiquitin activating enzyme [Leptomonas pyrrhocoris]KPA85535.1 putative ubiquitin activating enzyme [Leptomonas pyrrhocoris]|eukprot:XP_015663973.1 putative ubiquitin activating enzyme [Leptomonas pyrrhocoris]